MSAFGLPPVRVLRPALWCAGAVGTIYVGCAAYEIRHDAKIVHDMRAEHGLYGAEKTSKKGPVSMRQLDVVRELVARNGGRSPVLGMGRRSDSSNSSNSIIPAAWTELPEAGKLMAGLVSTNIGVFALERLLPGTSALFSHIPAAGTNFTMLASAFGHVGLTHLGLNMYGVVQFLPPVASSRTFDHSGSHLAAFYLSAGVLASYAYHLATVWPRPLDRVIPARGASGAVMAVVGAFGMSYPNNQLGIILIPFSLPASDFLMGLAAFEAYGLFVGFKRLPLAHAAHLAGLTIGAAYVHFDGHKRVWRPVKQATFNVMQRMSLV